MAFVFPEDKATFTAANGITYAWKDDHWVVQKFKGDSEVFVDSQPPNNPEEGKLWYDSSGDVLELFIYVEDKWVSATPNSEYALESRIAANEQGIRDLWADQQRQDFEIGGLGNRVEALEGVVGEYRYIIQTANQTPRDGQLAFLKGDMSTTTRWGEATNIAVNPNSIGGDVWATDEIVTGDVLRFHLKGDITMEVSAFEAKVVQNNNNLFGIDTVVKEVGTIMDGAEYEVFHLSSFDPSGLATMVYVDAQDKNLKDYTDGELADLQKYVDEKFDDSVADVDSKVDKSGDTMTGDLSFDGGSHSIRMLNGTKLRFTGSYPGYNQRTFIDTKNELSSGTEGAEDGYRMRLYHLADPTSPYHASNKRYVDQSIAAIPGVDLDGYATEQYVDDAISNIPSDYLPLSGGELTGDLKFKEGNKADHQFIINPNNSTADTNIYGLNGGQVRFRTSHTNDENDRQGSHIVLDPNGGTPETKIYNVVTPTNDSMAASKGYVDNAVTSAGAGPASLCWEWRNHDTLSDPGEGKAAWYSSSSFFRLNLKTANGVFLGKNVLSRNDVSFSQHLAGGIWTLVDGDWQMVQLFQIHRMQWNHNDCVWLYRNNVILGSNTFTAGQKYYFTVGGFF